MNDDREHLGKLVRRLWVKWARKQPDSKPSWLVEWDDLAEPDREVDRQIGDGIADEILCIFEEGRAAHRAGADGGDDNPYGTTLGRIWYQGWEFAATTGESRAFVDNEGEKICQSCQQIMSWCPVGYYCAN